MLSINEINELSNAYDNIKYPYGIYKDLVIDSKQHPHRFELMGAWKTGCIRIDNAGTDYTDSKGQRYRYTNRWAQHTPVGYVTWRSLDQSNEFCSQINDTFPDDMPIIIQSLVTQEGFGFIWAVFVAHICLPTIYPLYDQHVWRAYRYLSSNGSDCPLSSPSDWQSYQQYQQFFHGLLIAYNKPYWFIDRALWVFGKSVKKYVPIDSEGNATIMNSQECTQEWAYSTTLGRAKPFWWHIDADCNLTIGRRFKNQKKLNHKKIIRDTINDLLQYLPNDSWFSLAHNVQKLARGSEKNGIGLFLYRESNFSETEAQLASHIATLFHRSNLWDYNGKLCQQAYRKKGAQDDWCKFLKQYYSYLLSNI